MNFTEPPNPTTRKPGQGDSAIVLVATGEPAGGHYSNLSQILDIKSLKICKNIQPYPLELSYATGDIVSGSPIICGGGPAGSRHTNKCYTLNKRTFDWNYLASLSGKRHESASVSLDGALWVTGNYNLFSSLYLELFI